MSHKASVGGLYALHKTKSILIVSANSSLVNVPEDGWEVEVSKQETVFFLGQPCLRCWARQMAHQLKCSVHKLKTAVWTLRTPRLDSRFGELWVWLRDRDSMNKVEGCSRMLPDTDSACTYMCMHTCTHCAHTDTQHTLERRKRSVFKFLS